MLSQACTAFFFFTYNWKYLWGSACKHLINTAWPPHKQYYRRICIHKRITWMRNNPLQRRLSTNSNFFQLIEFGKWELKKHSRYIRGQQRGVDIGGSKWHVWTLSHRHSVQYSVLSYISACHWRTQCYRCCTSPQRCWWWVKGALFIFLLNEIQSCHYSFLILKPSVSICNSFSHCFPMGYWFGS